ncbi:MAG: methyltransferase domain-containing protein [ANME-2 cluster archaeon]|nr:MAG: methyltransferase domain-containing protein [ANME-2 cluster archaeon]
MKLITQQQAFDLITFTESTNFTELLEDNLNELKALYPNEDDLDQKFKEYIKGTSTPEDVEMYDQFVRISRLYRNQPTISRIQHSISIAQEYGCKTIMDFGAGGGTECIAYAKSGLSTTYADRLNLKNSDTIKKRFQLRNLNIKMVNGDNLPQEKYDIISAYDVLEHLYDLEHYLSELLIRLHWDGFFIIYPDFDNISFNGDHLEKNIVYRDIFQNLLETVGLEKFMEGTSVDIYRKIKSDRTLLLYENDGEIKRKLYSFVKKHCEQVINKSFDHMANQKSAPLKKVTSKFGLTETIRSIGGRLPLPQQIKRKTFAVYRKTFDESLLDKITDHYTVYRIVEYKLKHL